MLFVYDENNSPIGFRYNNDYYTYAKNLHGDIVEIYDNAGNVVTKYAYDAWGNIISTTGSRASTVGAANPFRYRGYYWDSETGLYWLYTRYYDPAIGRFINADGQLNTNQQLSGYNLYAYCNNNPVMFCDPDGDIAITTLILIGSVVAGALAAGHTAAVSYKYTGEVDIQHTFEAFISTFALVYSLGTSAYAVYENFCYYRGKTPRVTIGANHKTSQSVSSKKVPNPYGKKGGPAHQAEINRQVRINEAKGFKVDTEVKISTPGGMKPVR